MNRPLAWIALALFSVLCTYLWTQSLRSQSLAGLSSAAPEGLAPDWNSVELQGTNGEVAREREVESKVEVGTVSVAAMPKRQAPSTAVKTDGEVVWFFGRILEKESDRPLGRVRVARFSGADISTGVQAEEMITCTDVNGRFELAVPKGNAEVDMLAAIEGRGLTGFSADQEHTSPDGAMVIRMARSAVLTIQVQGLTGGAAGPIVLTTRGYNLAHDRGKYWHWREFYWKNLHWTVPLDSFGRGEVELPANAEFRMSLKAGPEDQVYADEISLEPGEKREVVWGIGSGTRVLGRLVDDQGHAIAAAQIWLIRDPLGVRPENTWRYFAPHDSSDVLAKATTDTVGRFEFADVSAGSVFIGPGAGRTDVQPASWGFCRMGVRVEILEGVNEMVIEIVAPRGLTVKGRVADPDDQPPGECSLYLFPMDSGGGERGGQMSADGTFVFDSLMPGPHQLYCYPLGGSFAISPLQDVQTGEHDVLIKLEPGNSISGMVKDAATGQVVPAQIIWTTPPSILCSIVHLADGQFSRKNLPSDSYALTAVTADGRIGKRQRLRVADGTNLDGVEILVAPGAWLTVSRKGGIGYANCTVTQEGAVCAFMPITGGVSPRIVVPTGPVIVTFKQHNGPTVTHELDLLPGDEKRLDFSPEEE